MTKIKFSEKPHLRAAYDKACNDCDHFEPNSNTGGNQQGGGSQDTGGGLEP